MNDNCRTVADLMFFVCISLNLQLSFFMWHCVFRFGWLLLCRRPLEGFDQSERNASVTSRTGKFFEYFASEWGKFETTNISQTFNTYFEFKSSLAKEVTLCRVQKAFQCNTQRFSILLSRSSCSFRDNYIRKCFWNICYSCNTLIENWFLGCLNIKIHRISVLTKSSCSNKQ